MAKNKVEPSLKQECLDSKGEVLRIRDRIVTPKGRPGVVRACMHGTIPSVSVEFDDDVGILQGLIASRVTKDDRPAPLSYYVPRLKLLADWFDAYDDQRGSDKRDVQHDLRKLTSELEARVRHGQDRRVGR